MPRMSEDKNYVTVKLGPTTRWLLSIVPASIFYCVGLYAIILLFMSITYLSYPAGCQGRAQHGAYVAA